MPTCQPQAYCITEYTKIIYAFISLKYIKQHGKLLEHVLTKMTLFFKTIKFYHH